MSVSQTAEYALRAVVWLADKSDKPQTTQQLADGTKVSPSYLPKVLQPLSRAGVVASQRGVKGGYTLNRDPEELTVIEVVSCVDSLHRIRQCPLRLGSHDTLLCPLHQMLDDAVADVERRFSQTTIAGLLKRGTRLRPLCETAPATLPVAPLATQEAPADAGG